MSVGKRVSHVVVDVLGIDPLRDESYEAVRRVRVYKTYTVTDSDKFNLPLIANRIYGNAELWWVILVYNDVSDPFGVVAGTRLRIPNYDQLISELSATINKSQPNVIAEL